MQPRMGVRVVAIAAGLAAALVPMATGAQASSSPDTARPAAPSGIRIVAVSPSSFTVISNPAAHATSYRLYASTVRSDLFTANVHNAQHSPWRSSPKLTVAGLAYAATPYYYRIEAMNGRRTKFSQTIGAVGLRPSAPTGLAATANHHRSYLSWTAADATGYQIERAKNAAMTSYVHLATVLGTTGQYTPYGVNDGKSYYFRVRSLNLLTPSSWSPVVAMTTHTSSFNVRVMTYNILEAFNDGKREGGNVIAPWSKRKPGIVKDINLAHPDVVGIQEGASFVGAHHVREVVSLKNALSGYALADTEPAPHTVLHWHRTGVYILYRKSMFAKVGNGGHWDIGNYRWAAWQVLKNRATKSRFLFVSAHLRMQPGRASDVKREHETEKLVADARKKALRLGIPVVYVGDFNSDQYARHAFNGVTKVMARNDIADAYQAAQKRFGGTYNTANGYRSRPPKDSAHIDYIFAPAGVAVRTWKDAVHLSHGRFVGAIPSDHNAIFSDLSIPFSEPSSPPRRPLL